MSKKKPVVVEVPGAKEFAHHMANNFLEEKSMSIDSEDPEDAKDPLGVILSVPELHDEFTIWLCEVIREISFEETGSPTNVILN